MEEPLTPEEKQVFLKRFGLRFYENYDKALKSGAISEEDLEEHDHIVARCVLIITAHQFEPISPKGKEMLSNLDKFI